MEEIMLHQGALYHHHTPARELEEAMWFLVPMAHTVAAMNGHHREAGHQGEQWTLSLLQDWFWWPGMARQVAEGDQYLWKVYSAWRCPCLGSATAILITSPLELFCVDFTGIETMMELGPTPHIVNVLVFLWPLYETWYGICDFWSDCKNCC